MGTVTADVNDAAVAPQEIQLGGLRALRIGASEERSDARDHPQLLCCRQKQRGIGACELLAVLMPRDAQQRRIDVADRRALGQQQAVRRALGQLRNRLSESRRVCSLRSCSVTSRSRPMTPSMRPSAWRSGP